jgi:hypothetical protein
MEVRANHSGLETREAEYYSCVQEVRVLSRAFFMRKVFGRCFCVQLRDAHDELARFV